MSSLTDRFATNKDKEKEGIWYTVHENDDGTFVQFKISRSGQNNARYLKAVERLTKPYRSARSMANALVIRLSKQAYVDTCIHEWKNVSLNGSDNLGFSKDNLDIVFKQLPDLLELLMTVSDDPTYFQDTLEEDVKNSPTA